MGISTLTSEIREKVKEHLVAIAAEQESLDRRRKEAEALLASLPADRSPSPASSWRTATRPKEASISSLIIQAVRNKEGATAADIVSAVRSARPEVNGKVIHAILYRLRAVDGKIRHEGDRGEMTYFVVTPTGKAPPKKKHGKRSRRPYTALAKKLLTETPGRHSVAEVAKAIGCPSVQARNILVRLNNDGFIQRVSEGVYEAKPREAVVPSG